MEMADAPQVLGIDIGGSGIKAGWVDLHQGEMTSERMRFETPDPATPEDVLGVLDEVVAAHPGEGPIGVGFPGVIRENIVHTAVNLHPDWIEVNLGQRLQEKTGREIFVLNDADAAGLAEVQFGAGKGVRGVVIVLTVGTGIGSAIFVDGKLVPNTEIGHMLMKGGEAEALLSKDTRKAEQLAWKHWARRFDKYLAQLEALFWPELFIIGGGGAKKPERYLEHLTVRTKVIPAAAGNRAGIIGAAFAAARGETKTD